MKNRLKVLENARELLRGGDYSDALRVLLKQFRATPTIKVGDLIVKLGPIVGNQSKFVGLNDFEQLKSIRKSSQFEAVSPALNFITTGTMNQAVERIEVINQWDSDPRIDRQLLRWLFELPYQSGGSKKFWSRVIKRLKSAIDPTVICELPQVSDCYEKQRLNAMQRWLLERIDSLLPMLEVCRDEFSFSEDEFELANEVFDLIPEKLLDTQEQLLAAVLENPDDDQYKLVYADYLVDHRDPHGEFIQLQFAKLEGELSQADTKREKELLDKHWRNFVGPLEKVVYRERLEFEKGFVSKCYVRDVVRLTALLDCPYWITAKFIYLHPDSLRLMKGQPALASRCRRFPSNWG